MRAILSIKPPGGNGTISLMGLAGHACAVALVLRANKAIAAALAMRSFLLVTVWVNVMVAGVLVRLGGVKYLIQLTVNLDSL
jgi:hypothetical protein